MTMQKHRVKPSARCIRCGETFTDEDWADVHARYTQHVVNKHGLPGHASQTGDGDMGTRPVSVDE